MKYCDHFVKISQAEELPGKLEKWVGHRRLHFTVCLRYCWTNYGGRAVTDSVFLKSKDKKGLKHHPKVNTSLLDS